MTEDSRKCSYNLSFSILPILAVFLCIYSFLLQNMEPIQTCILNLRAARPPLMLSIPYNAELSN